MKEAEIVQEDLRSIVERLGGKVDDLSGKTLLITGPSGLLGSYLVETIAYLNDHSLKEPCRVVGIARTAVTAEGRLGHLLGRSDIKFIEHDVANPLKIDEDLDYIVHAAGRSAPAVFQSDPLGTIDLNVKGVRWLLDLAVAKKVKSFLYFSSGEIYGSPPASEIPTKESYYGNVSTAAPRACYTEGKRLAETLCFVYHQKFGLPVKIVRPFVVYGPGLEIGDRRVIVDFIRQGIEGKPIEMLSPGLDRRCYCYISDGTVAFFDVLLSDLNGEVFNVGGERDEITIRDLARLIHSLFAIKESVKFPAAVEAKFISDAPSRVRPDVGKLREKFNFEQRVGLEEGLRRTINWILLKQNLRPLGSG